MRWRQRELGLFELTIVVIVMVLLVKLAIDRILPLRVEAERMAVAQVVSALRSALGLASVERVVRGGVDSLVELAGSNPMALLQQRPAGYLGELERPDPLAVPPGSWYFDRARGVLVYRVRFADRFRGGAPGRPPRIRFRVRLVFDDVDGDGRFTRGRDVPRGLGLVALEPYEWVKDGARRPKRGEAPQRRVPGTEAPVSRAG